MGLRLLCLLIAAACLGGCNYVDELKLPVLTTEGRALDEDHPGTPAPRYYPDAAPIAEPLDIELIRVGNAIVIDNRTVHEYKNVQLWLNHAYGGDLEALPIGRTDPIALTSFINEHAEPYPVARFLAPDADMALVLADLYLDGKIHKLTVRLRNDWRRP
ncbi:MAG: hypothetical protein GC162_05405 [Planctomycetes bacterium]|nr:hypothetical protein [Planctomycetota bacterium]